MSGRPSSIPINPGALFGKWTVVRFSHTGKHRATFWLCRCSCGTEKVKDAKSLRNGRSTQCRRCSPPYLRSGLHVVRVVANGPRQFESERAVWKGMISRCYCVADSSFIRYGARGIKVADCWRGPRGFYAFLSHVGPRPSAEHSIDRFPDNNGNYEPGNVRWATRHEQARNKSSNKMITINGVTKCQTDWERETGLPVGDRIRRGWPETMLLTPARCVLVRHCRTCACNEINCN